MPQKTKKYTQTMQDGRRKLHPDEHIYVKRVYDELHSQRKTAEFFNISRRLVTFILFPDRYKEQQKKAIERKAHKEYYTKESQREYMRTYRAKKRKLGYIEIKTKPRRAKFK